MMVVVPWLRHTHKTTEQEGSSGVLGNMPEGPVADVDASEELKQPLARKCAELPVPPQFWAEASRGQAPFIDIPQSRALAAGDTVCVRVVVPPTLSENVVDWAYVPLEGSPWDSVAVDLVGHNTGVSVPVQLEMVDHVDNYHRDRVHVYQADVQLRDADTYGASGRVEYRHALWNRDQATMRVPEAFIPEALDADQALRVEVTDNEGLFSLAKYQDLPLCTEADSEGRWIPVSRLPFDPLLVPEADERGLVWLPYDCRLKRYSYSEFAQCLGEKYPLVHWTGDANTRRALKKVSTLGQWCSTPEQQQQSKVCLCDDAGEKFDRYNVDARVARFDLDPEAGAVEATGSGAYARIVVMRGDGLLNDGTVLETQPASLVVLGGAATDAGSYAQFAGEVRRLGRLLADTSDGQTPVFVRTAQHVTQNGVGGGQQQSRLRNLVFDRLLVAELRRQLGSRVHVWNVAGIAERRPLRLRMDGAAQCPGGQQSRSELVETENTVLVNALCNSEKEVAE